MHDIAMLGIYLTVQNLRNNISSEVASNIWWKLLYQPVSWEADQETSPLLPISDF